jgi:WhiB family redox-sensing transcriptional regulator
MIDPATIEDRNCATIHRELFFPAKTDTPGEREAKRACHGCPALDVCLEFALTVEDGIGTSGRHGIYGGMTPKERGQLARRKGKAA